MTLEGTWHNELGSTMVLKVVGKSISGNYVTGVGDAEGSYDLVGSTDPSPSNEGQAVGWVVVWSNDKKNSHAVTTWSGEYQVNDGQEVITTTWLLTSETNPDDDWASTLVGQDVFSRNPPEKDTLDRRTKQRRPPHPTR